MPMEFQHYVLQIYILFLTGQFEAARDQNDYHPKRCENARTRSMGIL